MCPLLTTPPPPAAAAPPTATLLTSVPKSSWTAQIHPLVEQVSKDVDAYFLGNWPFPNAKARKKFVAAGFSRVTCLYFPKALDDRIHFACQLLTLLFLIDDLLEYMSLEDGKAYNDKLMPIARGDALPDQEAPVELIMYDLWESMRAHDREMADDILEPVFTFMRAQTDESRLKKMGLGEYLQYREADVGKALLGALMRFSMGLKVPAEDLALVRSVDQNCAKHLSVVNDIWSFEKEVMAAEKAHEEGGVLCSAVAIFADEAELPVEASKRVLYHLSREWEATHERLAKQALGQRDTPELRQYVKGLEYQMSGNEKWSMSTMRYLAPQD